MELKLKMLLVDDDNEFAEIFKWKMKAHLKNIELANNGQEAVKMYHPDSYNVMVIDKNLPDKSGEEVLNEISKSHPLPKLTILLTGTVMPEDEKKALELGVDRYLEKDFEFNYIKEILQEAKIKNLI